MAVDVLVLKETAEGERRVAATPETVKKLVSAGAQVHLQAGAGAAAGFPDQAYVDAGAQLGDVLEGADLEIASKRVLDTIINNSGQSCSALTRMIAPKSMKEEVERALLDRLQTYKVGDPTQEEVDAGPVQSKKQYDKVKGFIEKGVKAGANLLSGEIPRGSARGGSR